MIKSGLRPTARLRIATVLLRKTDRRDAPFAVIPKSYETNVYMPLMSLNDTGISEFERICSENGCFFQRPRISKLKSFLESAITKFHIQDTGEYNILCINWSYTDIVVNGYIEPTMLLFNKVGGGNIDDGFEIFVGGLSEKSGSYVESICHRFKRKSERTV